MTPIEKRLSVPLPPTEAYDLFTREIDSWWPKASHSVKGEKSRLWFGSHKGDRIVEVTEDGSEIVWGTILAADPGRFLAFTWHPGKPASEATTVKVAFTGTEAGTRVELTHGGFEVLGPTAEAVSTSYLKGWDLVLGCFFSAVPAVEGV